jgi:hypothetical protein
MLIFCCRWVAEQEHMWNDEKHRMKQELALLKESARRAESEYTEKARILEAELNLLQTEKQRYALLSGSH